MGIYLFEIEESSDDLFTDCNYSHAMIYHPIWFQSKYEKEKNYIQTYYDHAYIVL